VTAPMTLPRGVTTLLNKAGIGWRHRVQHGHGHVDATELGEPRGDGTRPRVAVEIPAESIGVRFDHVDGRAAVAVWAKRQDKTAYAFAFGMRGRGEGEHAPVECNARDLGAYLSDER